MGLYASFDVIGDFGFIEATEDWGIEPDYGPGCEAFCSTFEAVANSLVPVDTGYLQSSISASTDGNSFCEVTASAEYAQYVEYGTWKMAAQAYFTPALEEALGAAEPLWHQAEEEAIREDELLTEEEEAEQEAAAARESSSGGRSSGGSRSSSAASWAGATMGAAIAGAATILVQAMTGHDFRDHSSNSSGSSRSGSKGSDEGGGVFLPDIVIT